MFLKIVMNDVRRKKIITATVLVFIAMAVVLGSSATNIIANLMQSIAQLKTHAVPSDLTQMHIGSYDQGAVDALVAALGEHIAEQETMYLLNIEGSDIHFGANRTMVDTVQDISFVVQNQKFDFILDLDNRKLDIQAGEVAVPIYFMKTYGLSLGDVLRIESRGFRKEFVISEYARDFEMNSALASSKRFVINQADYDEMLEHQVGEMEYLIEFKLHEHGDLRTVRNAYREAGLPSNGPTIEGRLFSLFNALSDAAVVMVIVLISLLLVVVASLCIRLTFLATIDEDLREIGVMKAMGISKKDIRNVYLTKYKVVATIAGVLGYALSFLVVRAFNGNMRLYLSSDLSGSLQYVLSLFAPVAIYLIVVLYCRSVLGRIDGISATEALRSDIMQRGKHRKYRFPLLKNRFLDTSTYLGLRDVATRIKLYRLLFFIFIVCTFIAILPLNVFNTMNSPKFSTYMGIGQCDVRIDLRKTDTITADFERLLAELENDSDIEKHAAYITCSYPAMTADGRWDYILIETGDFSVFPLQYLEGTAPAEAGEISLSFAQASADGLDKKVGDTVVVQVGGVEKQLKVSGIYQDITNGGKTAKAGASLGLQHDAILWYMVNLDIALHADVSAKMAHYQSTYASAQVNGIKEYARQTMGNIIRQMGAIVIGGLAIAIVVMVLITALFLKMLLSKDMSQIAIMRSIGLSAKQIEHQYLAGTMAVLLPGIILGILAADYLGEILVSMAMSSMGAASIRFVGIAWQTWLVYPLLIIVVVGITLSLSCKIAVAEDLSVVLRS